MKFALQYPRFQLGSPCSKEWQSIAGEPRKETTAVTEVLLLTTGVLSVYSEKLNTKNVSIGFRSSKNPKSTTFR